MISYLCEISEISKSVFHIDFSENAVFARKSKEDKDEVDFEKCNNLNELKNEINEYIDYYNNYIYISVI